MTNESNLVNKTFPHGMGNTIKKDHKPSKREEILTEAIKCVTKDRNSTHGDPEDNFKTIAAFWTIWLRAIGLLTETRCISPIDVAVMMDLMKTSRLVKSPEHMDHWVDKAGYAACGGGIASEIRNY